MNKPETSRSKNDSSRFPVIPLIVGHRMFRKALVLLLVGVSLALILFPYSSHLPLKSSVGSIAQNDIRADRDLVVMDRAATEKKKSELIASFEPVFDFDADIAAFQNARLVRAFTAAEHVLRPFGREASPLPGSATGRSEALKRIRTDFEAALGSPLTDREFNILKRSDFSPDLLNDISKLLFATYQLNIVSRGDFMTLEHARGIMTRNVKTHQENDLRNLYSLVILEDLKPFLQKHAPAMLGPFRSDVRELAVSIVARLAQPNLTLNKHASEARKQSLLEKMQPVYIKILKNEFIIREGQPITPQVADQIEAFEQALGGGKIRGGVLFLGILSTVLLIMTVMHRSSERVPKSPQGDLIDLLFLGTVSILQMLLVRMGMFIAEAVHHAFPLVSMEALYFAIPFALGPVLVAGFITRNMALVFAIFSSLLVTFLFDDKILFFLLSFLGGAVSVHHMIYFNQRSAFYRAGIFAGLINMLVILCAGMLSGHLFSADLFLKLAGGLTGGILSGIIVSGIAPLLESLFGYTTHIKLLELANLNQPLLQRMIVESPGTYHHSIVVASLVEAAAEAIQADSLLAKVSAYYHDIGKLTKPLYFIENQQNWKNKHDKLSPKMSSLVIISHVKDGCDLAQRFKLGRTLTDIIRQHHGTGVVSYFYEKAQKDKDPSIRSIPESDFRYPGPKPQTKEAGLVLLGDVVEASSRTLTDPTPSRIRNLVQTRIKQVYADGQLDNCELSLRDLHKIADVFERTLNAIFHQRVDYPEGGVKDPHSRKDSNGVYDFKPAEKARSRH